MTLLFYLSSLFFIMNNHVFFFNVYSTYFPKSLLIHPLSYQVFSHTSYIYVHTHTDMLQTRTLHMTYHLYMLLSTHHSKPYPKINKTKNYKLLNNSYTELFMLKGKSMKNEIFGFYTARMRKMRCK